MYSRVLGTGSALPKRIVTNGEFAAMLARDGIETSDEWIRTRTGIESRHFADEAEGETTSSLAVAAARRALEAANVETSEIDLIIVATTTPDMVFPSVACRVQAALGARGCAAFDVQAVCAGFIYALNAADAMLRAGPYRAAIVIGAEVMSRVLDMKDRSTCVLFGDGSGAVVLAASGEENAGILGNVLGADGSDTAMLCMPAGGSAMPPSERTVREGLHYLKMDGREVFKHAVRIMQEKALEVLDLCGVSAEDVSLLIPHQANTRIIETVAKRLKIPSEKVYVNIENYGNTSSASIPIALDEVVRGDKVKKGDLVLLVAFGAGLTWGATLIRF